MLDDPETRRSVEILVVDDTLPNLRLLAGMLTSQGYRVREAANGPEALEAIQRSQPDLILLDVRMPGMDGYEVCRRIKADEHTHNIPVIFVSALDDQMDKIQGFTAGGLDYITKPFYLREVLARVDTQITLRKLQHRLEQQNAQLQREVEERLRAERALQAANEALEQRVQERTAEARRQAQQVVEIMNSVPEGLLLLQEDGSLIVANPTAEMFLQTLTSDEDHTSSERAIRVIHHLGDIPLANLLKPPPQGLFHEVACGRRVFEIATRPVDDNDEQGEHEASRRVMLIREVTGQGG